MQPTDTAGSEAACPMCGALVGRGALGEAAWVSDDVVARLADQLRGADRRRHRCGHARGESIIDPAPCAGVASGGGTARRAPSYGLSAPFGVREDDAVETKQLAKRPRLKRTAFGGIRRLGVGNLGDVPKAGLLEM